MIHTFRILTYSDTCFPFRFHAEAEPAVNEVLPVNRCEQYENECAALSCPYGKHRVAVDEECSRCECDNPCADYECPDGQQCAVEVSNERSGEFKPECRLINKPGICPRLTASDGVCGRECNTDADCRENNKCCSNGCGFVCVHPAVPTRPTTAPTTPAPVVVYPEDVKASLVPKEKAETDVNTPLGGIAVLRCFATGNPAPNVTWSRNNVVVSATSHSEVDLISSFHPLAGRHQPRTLCFDIQWRFDNCASASNRQWLLCVLGQQWLRRAGEA